MKLKDKEYIKIGSLVSLTGFPKTTIRFYIDNGLLPPPYKTSKTMAYYDVRHVRILNEIKKHQMGNKFSVSELKKRLARFLKEDMDAKEIPETILTEEAKKKKAHILKAAVKIFSEKGYYRTTINDVTLEAKISTGTFYFYFKDKHQLYTDVIDDLILTITKTREKILKGETDIFGRVLKRGKVIYENFDKYKEIIFLVRAEMEGEDEWAKNKVSELYKSLSESVGLDIQRMIDQGGIREVDTKLVAYSFIGLIEIMILLMKLESGYDIDQILRFLSDFVMKGLEPRNNE